MFACRVVGGGRERIGVGGGGAGVMINCLYIFIVSNTVRVSALYHGPISPYNHRSTFGDQNLR